MPNSTTQGKKTCFVIQGFGEKTDFTTGRKLNLDASYQVIKEAAEEAGLECMRADEIKHSGTIDKPMYQRILHADLVIADLSTYNVNAAYELGVRYGLRRYATIIVAEDQFKNPFDVSHIVIRPYKHLGEDIGVSEARRFKKELKDAIAAIMAEPSVDSPVYTFLKNLSPPVETSGLPKAPPPAPAAGGHAAQGGRNDGEFLDQVLAAKTRGELAVARFGSASPADQSAKQLLDQAIAAEAKGDFARARPLLQAVQQMRPNDDYVVQQLALATYKSKQPDPKTALEEARSILKTLNPESTNDPETLGLWGAVHKRLWEITEDRGNLDESIAAFERGFYLKQDYYNGINLAFLLNVRAALDEKLGARAEAVADFVVARRVHRQVLKFCEEALKAQPKDYWILATMWEAAVGLGDDAAAAKWEEQAKPLAGEGWMLESTRSQLDKLKGLLQSSPLKNL
jgi:tetratricopeptide (TPR) repeat protein